MLLRYFRTKLSDRTESFTKIPLLQQQTSREIRSGGSEQFVTILE
ncbi:MAG: hypothetical protein SW833_27145 [Cyanobacteriota bacterium]|nr:hypothetical protein [Cyanobacteriota bacterium]